MATNGLMIAGLASGSGKTLVALALLRALRQRGHFVSAAKTGPDYIDTGFLTAASGNKAVNLDPFAMSSETVRHLGMEQPGDLLVVEGVMGLFDGAENGVGSSTDLASILDVPAVLVIDVRHMAQTAAMLAAGLRAMLPARRLAGVILNRVASPRHLGLIKAALDAQAIPLLGALPQDNHLSVPSRHLGLVQAADLAAHDQLDSMIEAAARAVETHCDLDAIVGLARPLPPPQSSSEALARPLPNAPAQRIAVAQDAAFGFAYAHLLDGWRRQGADIVPFSPLADAAPTPDADFIFLPGGYPELHLPQLCGAENFMAALRAAAAKDIPIYGECGGFMVLGQTIADDRGEPFRMAGLLDVDTSFQHRRRHLGYRHLTPIGPFFWPGPFRGHEFHYTMAISARGASLFEARDAGGEDLGRIGLKTGSVAGSYAHIIASADPLAANRP